MTARSEYRLLLRQDNADQRLTPLGFEIGLVSEEQYDKFMQKKQKISQEKSRIFKVIIKPSDDLNKEFISHGISRLNQPQKMGDLLKRPGVGYSVLEQYDQNMPDIPADIKEQVEIDLKYEGYIKKQQQKVEVMRKLETKKLPLCIDYSTINELRLEAREKLNVVRPINLGQALRISGVNPADVAVLSIWLKRRGGANDK